MLRRFFVQAATKENAITSAKWLAENGEMRAAIKLVTNHIVNHPEDKGARLVLGQISVKAEAAEKERQCIEKSNLTKTDVISPTKLISGSAS